MKRIGLWIDHKKAVIVIESGQGESIQQIESGVGRHVSYRGAANSRSPYSAQYQQGDDQLDNKYAEQLKKFYDKVIAHIRGAESVLILGPGEAKLEFEKRLAHDKVNVQIVGVETADKMTELQIAAKVRNHFQEIKTNSRT
jgi:stalled ribosome rescue protein Dom34